jgi:hypothetical protein
MVWIIQDSLYLASGFVKLYTIFILDYLNIIKNGERQVEISELLNPDFLSQFIGKKVRFVQIDRGASVGAGAGGNGTDRAPLIVRLDNDEELHLFVKIPTHQIIERIFLTLFKVYDNELKFYTNHVRHLNRDLSVDSWDVSPKLYCCR